MYTYTSGWALFGCAWEDQGLWQSERPKQQLVCTDTFPISAQGGSYNSHFITLGGRVKDKARTPINKTNVFLLGLWRWQNGLLSFLHPRPPTTATLSDSVTLHLHPANPPGGSVSKASPLVSSTTIPPAEDMFDSSNCEATGLCLSSSLVLVSSGQPQDIHRIAAGPQ
ncbi:hypothetical protein UPYG_G00032350 [Umbra pygmaea]|uniref:Uncharacterized protein n=1 Tax=Umbra pygmaea TaxID=75934 RepID=A0ABD0XN27_UMBPY